MQYLMIFTPDTKAPPSEQDMADMAQFVTRSREAGELLATGGLFAAPTRVRRRNGDYTVTDGPYAESKEVIAGFALLQLGSDQAALDAAHRFLAIAGDGVSEIHRVADGC
jgi:hypothetical protein